MLRASALYLVIVIALVMGVLCSAVIAAGYYYRSYAQRYERAELLRLNLQSGINLLLAAPAAEQPEQAVSLFGGPSDSLLVQKVTWGLFDLGTVRAFIQQDTLSRALLIAAVIDSAKWAALQVIDEDRSLSVSGHTHIRGNVWIPKAGIREAYVNNQAYTGNKQLVDGHQYTSNKELPALLAGRLQKLAQMSIPGQASDSALLRRDGTVVSFLKGSKCFRFEKKPATLAHIVLRGRIVLYSDTSLTIDSTATLDNIVIFARSIRLNSGFKGRCQLFARDSVYIGPRCTLAYPSAVGVLGRTDKDEQPKKLALENASTVQGMVFIWEKQPAKLPPLLSLGKHAVVYGQVYVQGLVNFQDDAAVFGSVAAHRFLYQTAYTRYENYLINLDIDAARLSRYYLTSDLAPAAGHAKKVLAWLP